MAADGRGPGNRVPAGGGAGWRDRLTVGAYRLGSRAARALPERAADRLPELVAPVLSRMMAGRAEMISRHIGRAEGRPLGITELRRDVNRAFESYARYYVESFRLPEVPVAELDSGIEVVGYEHLEAGRAAGRGVILALPHLGGWEWAGFWLARYKQQPVSVVVESLEPPELFEWFRRLRETLGMKVIPLDGRAAAEVAGALGRNEVVCLLCDRDIGGSGVEVDFMGERTTLPAGPVMFGLRSGCPVLPTAVYFRPDGTHLGVVRPPLDLQRRGRLRQDLARGTQQLADELAALIRRAPDQWHLFQPNWPSDTGG